MSVSTKDRAAPPRSTTAGFMSLACPATASVSMRRPEFLGLMTKLCVAFDKKNDESRLEVYWTALHRYTLAQFTAVVDAWVAI